MTPFVKLSKSDCFTLFYGHLHGLAKRHWVSFRVGSGPVGQSDLKVAVLRLFYAVYGQKGTAKGGLQ